MRLIAFVVLAFLTAAAPARSDQATDNPVVATMFYSGLCGACQVLDPRIEAVKPDFAERDIDFVRFNQTFSLFNKGQLKKLAAEHGVESVWEEYAGKTGFMLLVDPRNDRVLEVITMRHSKEEIRAAINDALARA